MIRSRTNLLNQSPVQKGIETSSWLRMRHCEALNQSPVQKGIETRLSATPLAGRLLNQSPVQKGIETKSLAWTKNFRVEPEPRSEGD